MITLIITLISLIFLSAFTSAVEAAYFSLSHIDIKDIERKKKGSYTRIGFLMQYSDRFLISILFYNNFINVTIGYYTSRLTNYFHFLKISEQFVLLIVTLLMTLIVIIFSEYLPKIYAIKLNRSFAINTSFLAYIMYIAFSPISFILSKVLHFGGGKEDEKRYTISEYKSLIELSKNKGIIDLSEAKFINNFLSFSNLTVSEIMTPRIKVTTLKTNDSYIDIINIIKHDNNSRYPVTEPGKDRIIGIFYIKYLTKYNKNIRFSVNDYIKEPIFVTKTSSAYKLLNTFEKKHMHMAIVIGEFGEFLGIVTMEDILEEVVGEIKDEFDIFKSDEINTHTGKFMEVSGNIEIDRLSDILDIDFKNKNIETLNGQLTLLLGHIPRKGDSILINNYFFRVLSVKNRIADRVSIKRDGIE